MSENSGGQASCHTPNSRLDRPRSSLAGHRDRTTALFRRGAALEDTHFEAGHLRVPLNELERDNGFLAGRRRARSMPGIDLILVSYDPAQFHHDERVITADRAGGLVPVALAGSARRWLVRHDN